MKKYELTQYELVKVRVDHKPNFPGRKKFGQYKIIVLMIALRRTGARRSVLSFSTIGRNFSR